jgi:hypothetical protein
MFKIVPRQSVVPQIPAQPDGVPIVQATAPGEEKRNPLALRRGEKSFFSICRDGRELMPWQNPQRPSRFPRHPRCSSLVQRRAVSNSRDPIPRRFCPLLRQESGRLRLPCLWRRGLDLPELHLPQTSPLQVSRRSGHSPRRMHPRYLKSKAQS